MASEVKRGLIRISSNYIRLFINVVLGLLMVRWILQGMGDEAFGLIALLGASVGIASEVKEISKRSLIREVAAAYHSGDDLHLKTVYNSAIALSFVLAGLSFLIFLIIVLIVPLLKISPGLEHAARWFLIAKGVESAAFVLLAPQHNMYLITERMSSHNLFLLVDRSWPAAAALAVLLMRIPDPAHGVIVYGWMSALGSVVGILVWSLWMVLRIDRRLIPDLKLARRSALKGIVKMGGWNFVTVTAMNLHIRLDAILMNLFFGLVGNAAFGLANTLSNYVRRLTMGMTDGLDAVSARVAADKGSTKLGSLIYHSTRLHAVVAFPAAAVILALSYPIIDQWVGTKVTDPAVIPTAVAIMQALVIGIATRSITDGWTRILYGAGHIDKYGPLILLGGLLNAPTAIFLIWMLPPPHDMLGPALAFSIVFTIFHMFLLPVIGARTIRVRYWEFIRPIIGPAVLTAVTVPALLAARRFIHEWNLLTLGAVIGAYGALYGVAAIFFLMSADERRMFIRGFARRIQGKADKEERRARKKARREALAAAGISNTNDAGPDQ